MATASDIIERLGGPAEIARATGFPLTTIASWGDSNFIPEWRRAPLNSLAKRKKVELTADEFPTPADRVSRRPVEAQAAA